MSSVMPIESSHAVPLAEPTSSVVNTSNITKIVNLVLKYNRYNDDYKNLEHDWRTGKTFDPKGPPQLLDALSTGCPLVYAKSTFKEYTPEIEQDIKDIATLMPESMNCVLGRLRCRNDVPPLHMACINGRIPLPIIEFLLEKGADPNATFDLNNKRISILEDVKNSNDILSKERIAAIKTLFAKYGAA